MTVESRLPTLEVIVGSLIFIVVWMSALLAALSWAMARAAHAVGSTRGQFRWGLAVVLATAAVNLAFHAITPVDTPREDTPPMAVRFHDGAAHFEPQQRDPAMFWTIVLPIAALTLDFIILKVVFRLSALRTLAPIGASLAASAPLVGVVVLRPWIFDALVFPTHAMVPTIEPGDRFATNKLLTPRRWDLVVYRTEGLNPDFVVCKRLVGLPGERLRFESGELFVDDEPTVPPEVVAGRLYATNQKIPETGPRYADGETITLGNDEYFFIGDNVEIANDSRYSGPSHASSLIGVVDLIYWPPMHARIVR